MSDGPAASGPALMRPVVVLVGAPGAGKTTVGSVLAARLGVSFRDTDADVVAMDGRGVADIFIADGESVFRELECAAVATALRDHDGVLALGGGAILNPATRALLADIPTVWLQVSAAISSARVGMGVSRPVFLRNVPGQLIELMRQRAPLYEQVSDVVVGTDDRTPEQVADAVIAALELDVVGGGSP